MKRRKIGRWAWYIEQDRACKSNKQKANRMVDELNYYRCNFIILQYLLKNANGCIILSILFCFQRIGILLFDFLQPIGWNWIELNWNGNTTKWKWLYCIFIDLLQAISPLAPKSMYPVSAHGHLRSMQQFDTWFSFIGFSFFLILILEI